MIEFGPWLPDLPPLDNPGVLEAVNVMPLAKSYGPFPAPAVIGGALDERCQGAAATLDNAGNVYVFAGDRTKLYRYDGLNGSWNDVSGAPYNTPDTGDWRFGTFGELLFATNYADPVQAFWTGADTAFSVLSEDAPRARYLATVNRFLVLAGTYDPVDGDRPQRVWWSKFNDPTVWPAPGTSEAQAAQSDFQDLVSGGAGWIQGIVGGLGAADAVIFQERAVTRMQYVGAPAIFSFDPVEGVRGTPAPGSIVQLGGLAYYLGEDGFYAFNGSESVPIGAEQVDTWFWKDMDPGHLDRIQATVDPINRLVMWAYPGQGNTAGLCNRVLIYRWSVRKWAVLEVETQTLARFLTTGYTLDQLDGLGFTLDTLPFPLDSRQWAGGSVVMGGFCADGRLFNFSGRPMAARVTSSEAEIASGGRRMMVRSVRPLTDAPNPALTVLGRSRLSDPLVSRPCGAMRADGTCPVRMNTRYGRVRVQIPAGTEWTHLQGLDYDAEPAEGR